MAERVGIVCRFRMQEKIPLGIGQEKHADQKRYRSSHVHRGLGQFNTPSQSRILIVRHGCRTNSACIFLRRYCSRWDVLVSFPVSELPERWDAIADSSALFRSGGWKILPGKRGRVGRSVRSLGSRSSWGQRQWRNRADRGEQPGNEAG